MNFQTFEENWAGDIRWDVQQCSGSAGLTDDHTVQFVGVQDSSGNIISASILCTKAGTPPWYWAENCTDIEENEISGVTNGAIFTITRHPPAVGRDKATLSCTIGTPVAPSVPFGDPGGSLLGSLLETFHGFLLAVVAFIVKLFIGTPPPSGAGPGSWVAEEGSNGNGLVYPVRAAS